MSGGQSLKERPGWAELSVASGELHAAEVLLGDPLASGTTVVPHLRAHWAAMHAAARAAGLGKSEASTPAGWLEGEIAGLDKRTRARLRRHLGQLSSATDPAASPKRADLREHVYAARELHAAVEPLIGGQPLRRRRQRVLWTCVGLVVLFGPVLAYLALTREVEGAGPWRATYFTDRKLEKELVVLREASVDHNWKKGPPLEAVPPDKFSVRWDSCVHLDVAGPLVLQVKANDAARVYVGGEVVIDAWERDAITRKRGHGSAAVELEAGVHHLRVEYFESMGEANISLAASFADEVPAPLPRARLSYPGDDFDDEDPCAEPRAGAQAGE